MTQAPDIDGARRIDQLEQVWGSLTRLGHTITGPEWDQPTALPGWSVKDCYSHLVGLELGLLGEPTPEVDVDHLPHLRNPFAVSVEPWIEVRRATPGPEVLAEWEAVSARRLDALRALGDDDWSAVSSSPMGDVSYDAFMEIRVFDSCMHEQDIRRAVGRSGHLEGPCAELSVGRIRAALGFVVGKRAGAPDGTTVVFDVTGAAGTVVAIEVVDGRAREAASVPSSPTTTLAMDVETFCALGGGRWDGATATANGRVQILGDRSVGDAVLAGMAITP